MILTDNESRAVPNVVDHCIIPIYETYQAPRFLIMAIYLLQERTTHKLIYRM